MGLFSLVHPNAVLRDPFVINFPREAPVCTGMPLDGLVSDGRKGRAASGVLSRSFTFSTTWPSSDPFIIDRVFSMLASYDWRVRHAGDVLVVWLWLPHHIPMSG